MILRLALAVAVTGLFLGPMGWVILKPVSLFVAQHEFIGYRYFTSLSILYGEPQNVDIVQGVPMGILQHVIVLVLTHVLGRSSTAISTLEAFAVVTLALAYVSGSGVLAYVWFTKHLEIWDRLIISLVCLVPWYAWTTIPLLLAPDYWVFEVPYAMCSVTWAILLIRSRDRVHDRRNRYYVLAGLWMAVGATLKISSAAIGALPAVVQLSLANSEKGILIRRVVVVIASGILGSFFLVWFYFLGNPHYTLKAIAKFVIFIAGPGGLDFGGLFEALSAPGSSFLRWTLVSTGLAALVTVGVLRLEKPAERRLGFLVAGYLTICFVGHIVTLSLRPASTTVLDVALYSLFVISLATTRPGQGAFLVCLMPLAYVAGANGYWNFPKKYPVEEYARARKVIAEVREYVIATKRPSVLFVPDSERTGQVVEQVVLVQGRLGVRPGKPGSLRHRLLPHTEVLGKFQRHLAALRRRISAGDVVIWAHQEPGQPTEEVFPVLKEYFDNPHSVLKSWRHNALGATRVIYVGYLGISVDACPGVESGVVSEDLQQTGVASPNFRLCAQFHEIVNR